MTTHFERRPGGAMLGQQGKHVMDRMLRQAIGSSLAPGVVAVAMNAEREFYAGAFGQADMASGVPMALDSIFRIASLTKIITSIAALQLVEQRKIGLHDRIDRYLAAFQHPQLLQATGRADVRHAVSPCGTVPTVLQLLTHTSGLGYDFTDPTLRDYVAGQGDDPGNLLLFEPGQRWQYGNSTEWLGRIVEAVSGSTLDRYFDAHIFGPLGMHETGFSVAPAHHARVVAVNLLQDDGSCVGDAPGNWPYRVSPVGDGGLFSTAGDYGKLLRMLLNGGRAGEKQILSQAGMALMTSNQIGDLAMPMTRTAMPDYSADFNFISPGRDKWSAAFLITGDQVDNKRSPGSLSWAGIFNTHIWLDLHRGVAGLLFMQMLPFSSAPALRLYDTFEQTLYAQTLF